MVAPIIDVTGQRFGRLIARRYTHITESTNRKRSAWECLCDCGQTVVIDSAGLRAGKSKSCGCLSREIRGRWAITHGASRIRQERWPEYAIWSAMKYRCQNPNNAVYKYYGGRGITVCQRWCIGEGGLSAFECFIIDMGRRPDPRLTIDRVENDGNYEPSNCRWATRREQNINKRARGTAGGQS